jgi:hypothetical protein
MAERRQKRDIQLEFAFDRLVAVKLEQVYEILVSDRVRVVRAGADVTGGEDENRRDLRQGVVGQTEGRKHDRQPDERADRLRARAELRRADGMGDRRRRL